MFRMILWLVLGLLVHLLFPDFTLLGVALVLFIGYAAWSLHYIALVGLALYGVFTLFF